MLSVKLDTGFNIEVDLPLSPLHRRIFAYLIDVSVLVLHFLLWSYIIGKISPGLLSEKRWLVVLIGIPPILYFPLMEIFTNGQTIGKKLLGIRVITLEGGQATVSQYILRWVFKTIDFPIWTNSLISSIYLPWYMNIFLFLGIASIIISRKSQRLGDIAAGTIVIFTRLRTSWQDTVFTEVETNYKPRFPQVMQMSDKDLNSLKMIIETIKKNKNHDLAFRISERIKSKLNIQADLDAQEFLENLLKDYNYYSSH